MTPSIDVSSEIVRRRLAQALCRAAGGDDWQSYEDEAARSLRGLADAGFEVIEVPQGALPPDVTEDAVAKALITHFFQTHHTQVIHPDEAAEALGLDGLRTIRLCEGLTEEGLIANVITSAGEDAGGYTAVRPLNAQDRETLRATLARCYLHGRCYSMAVALHRRTGWPLVAARHATGRLVHAGVRHPSGAFFDVLGSRTDQDVMNDYGAEEITQVSEERLHAADPKCWDERIARTERLLDDLFPDLPKSNRDARLDDFLAALHALCIEHGLCIRAPYPAQRPILYERYGNEVGFEAFRLITGGWTFDRVLRNSTG